MLLLAGARRRRKVRRQGAVGDLAERPFAVQNGFGFGDVPARIALLDEAGEHAVIEQRLGVEQSARGDVDGADMRLDEVNRVDRLAADLGVEVESAG